MFEICLRKVSKIWPLVYEPRMPSSKEKVWAYSKLLGLAWDAAATRDTYSISTEIINAIYFSAKRSIQTNK